MKELFYPVCIGAVLCLSFVMLTDLMSIDSKYDRMGKASRVEVIKVRPSHHAKKRVRNVVHVAEAAAKKPDENLYPIYSEKVTEVPSSLPATPSYLKPSEQFAPVTGAP